MSSRKDTQKDNDVGTVKQIRDPSQICVPTKISLLALLGAVAAIVTILSFVSTANIKINFGDYWILALFAIVCVAAFLFCAHFSGNKKWYAVPIVVGVVFAAMGADVITAAAPVGLSITDPSDNSTVGYAVSVSGTWQNIPQDHQLWLVLWSVMRTDITRSPVR